MSRKFLHVPGWSLRRKLALVLVFPIVFAVSLGVSRVYREWLEYTDHAAAASQVTVLPPAVDFLNAAENAAVVARRKTTAVDPKRDAAVKEVDVAADAFEAAADDADLTDEQREQVDSILTLSQQLRTNEGYLSVGQSVSQVRQLHQGITELVTQIVNEQAQPEPKLPVLVQTLDGRLALSMQQFQVAYDKGTTAIPVDLAAEVGVEGAAIDRLGTSLGLDDDRVMALTQGNSQRFGEVHSGGVDMGGNEAYQPYDEAVRRPARRHQRRPDHGGRERTTHCSRECRGHRHLPPGRRAPRPPGCSHDAGPDPSGARRCDPGRQRGASRGRRAHPRRRAAGRDQADRRHDRGGDGPARPGVRRPAPSGDHAGLGRGGAAIAGRATCSRRCRDATPP